MRENINSAGGQTHPKYVLEQTRVKKCPKKCKKKYTSETINKIILSVNFFVLLHMVKCNVPSRMTSLHQEAKNKTV